MQFIDFIDFISFYLFYLGNTKTTCDVRNVDAECRFSTNTIVIGYLWHRKNEKEAAFCLHFPISRLTPT